MVASRVWFGKTAEQKGRLPSAISEGAAMISRLVSRGEVETIADRVRVERQGGYSGVDAVLYILLYFTALPQGGLRGLARLCSGVSKRVGTLAGRSALMGSSSLSRLLQRVSLEEVHGFSRWLLVEASGVLAAMGASVAQWVDGTGTPFHLFAFDPVRLAIRHRGLPHGEELPSPTRRTGSVAAPGRVGRKRGEVVTSVGVLEHRGSGAVVDLSISPGNGDARAMFRQAVEAMQHTMVNIGAPLSSAVLATDGEYGTVPHLAVCARRGVRLITRTSRYEVLDLPAVRERLMSATWSQVQDSGSGPTRYATDIGVARIAPGKRTRDDDGVPFDPVEVRLVASTYPSSATASGCGVQMGSERVELFIALGLERSAFSGSDLVTLFYGRCGQEVAFAQHERVLDVQRVHSTNLGGQLMAMVVGFFVWNLRLAAAVALTPALPPAASSRPRSASGAPDDGRIEAIRAAMRAPIDARPAGETDTSVELVPEPPSEQEMAEPVLEEPAPPQAVPSVTPHDLVDELDWAQIIRRRHGWTWNPSTQVLTSIDDVAMRYQSHEWIGSRLKLRFSGVEDGSSRKVQATVAVPRSLSVKCQQPPPRPPTPRPPSAPRRSIEMVLVATEDVVPRFEVRWPEFVMAAAVRLLPNLVRNVIFRVHAMTTEVPERHPLVIRNRHERQHRRLDWTERTARHAHRGIRRVRIDNAPEPLRPWILGNLTENHGRT